MSELVNAPSRFLPITSLQVEHYHADTHSFAQRRSAISSVLNGLRHSLYRHGGGTPRSPSDDQGIQGSIFSALCFHSPTDPCRKLFAFTSGGVAPKPSCCSNVILSP